MAAFTITLSADRKTVTLSAMGHFDLSLGFALWQYCEPERNRHENYIIDLADVTDMRDSGLNWLIMFCQWARRSDARVRVVHARPVIAYRLLAAEVAHEPAWLVDSSSAVVDVPTAPSAVCLRRRRRLPHFSGPPLTKQTSTRYKATTMR